MTPQPGSQAIAIYILSNISLSKGNQTTWSINRIYQEKYFSLKIKQKMRPGD